MQNMVANRLALVNPPACAPEGWQPPARGYDDEDLRPLTTQERRARQVVVAMRAAQSRKAVGR